MNAITTSLAAGAADGSGRLPQAMILTLDPALTDRVAAAMAGVATLHRADPDAEIALAAIGETRPSLLLIDTDDGGAELEQMITRLRRALPGVALVALGDEGQADMILTCLRAGAADYVGRQAGDLVLRRVLRKRLERDPRDSSPSRLCPAKAVIGARASDSSREVALSLAVREATAPGAGTVLLLDLAPDAWESELALDVAPRYTLADALDDIDRLDATLLNGAVVQENASGLRYLGQRPGRAESASAADIGALVGLLRGFYDMVVVHLGHAATPRAASLLSGLPHASLVMTQSIAGAQAAAELMRQSFPGGVPSSLVLAVAEHDARQHPTAPALAGTLGISRHVPLPDRRQVLRTAANEGRFGTLMPKDRAMARGVAELSARLQPEGMQRAQRSLLQRLVNLQGLFGR
ncbi:hypothetical protein EOD42_21510 [Rhodovarius crocodyli]|uniref:Response regulator n=1 Tax=Rhodovarius crocodyli TaxID=1979269 RepID=A0A437M1G9_9PROT|nr:MinD/ParA family protein [Rhodovarius crocodyli]RVT91551.1 hypothetical protein EOD42_21510 [Rhodovarius crocodyli]